MNGLQNRKMVAVLLVITVCLWGGILWRLARYAGKGKENLPEPLQRPRIVYPVPEKLSFDYRDPFIETPEIPGTLTGKSTRSIVPPGRSVLPAMPPSFRFSGRIRKGKKDFLLFGYPDGDMLIWEKGKVDGYTIGKIYEDSVVLFKSGKNYTLSITD